MNSQTPMKEDYPEAFDRRDARRRRRAGRRISSGLAGSGTAWAAGLMLILLGAAFLLQDMGALVIPFTNWWALFLLIPAIGAFMRAARFYQSGGNRITGEVRGALLVGGLLSLLTLAFILNLNMNLYGPVLIILTGLGILANMMLSGSSNSSGT